MKVILEMTEEEYKKLLSRPCCEDLNKLMDRNHVLENKITNIKEKIYAFENMIRDHPHLNEANSYQKFINGLRKYFTYPLDEKL